MKEETMKDFLESENRITIELLNERLDKINRCYRKYKIELKEEKEHTLNYTLRFINKYTDCIDKIHLSFSKMETLQYLMGVEEGIQLESQNI